MSIVFFLKQFKSSTFRKLKSIVLIHRVFEASDDPFM